MRYYSNHGTQRSAAFISTVIELHVARLIATPGI